MRRVPDLRWTLRVALLGGLWGAVEATLGAALHAASVPFNGTLLTAIGIGIALVGFAATRNGDGPRPGTVLAIASVAALLKPLSPGGGSPLSPMVAILVEGLLAEGTLRLFRSRPSAPSFVAAMTAALLWDVLHPLLVGSLLAGREIAASYARIVGQGGRLLGLGPGAPLAIFAALAALRVALGVAAGLGAWSVARAVLRRTGDVRAAPDA